MTRAGLCVNAHQFHNRLGDGAHSAGPGIRLAGKCTACAIDVEPRKLERPSDHAPVMATLISPPS